MAGLSEGGNKPPEKVAEMTGKLTGVEKASVYRIRREAKMNDNKLKSPVKFRKTVPLLEKYDEFTKSAIRYKVHQFFFRQELPTLDKILAALNVMKIIVITTYQNSRESAGAAGEGLPLYRSGERGGQRIGSPLPIHRSGNLGSKKPASRTTEVCRSAIMQEVNVLTIDLESLRNRIVAYPEDIQIFLKFGIVKRSMRHRCESLPSKETLRGHSDSSFRGEDRKTFVRLHYRLCEYGKFNSPGLGRGRPRSTTPEVQEEILEALNMTPSISTRRVALQVNVPHTTVWRLLKEYQLYPYHLQRVQALSPADYPARVRFCQWFLQQYGVNPNFPALVLFTDEVQFTRDGITNFHNQHVWAYENPRATVPSHRQVRFSLDMWAGIIGDRLVGPHVLVNRLTGQTYTNFLEITIPHVLEDIPLINQSSTHSLLA
ncbi:hypothetical protein ANN_13874 [Periplaneta americana]|uniref:Transposase n=1 Tax=Periplaneta americana TaxID=6978 RepID=A0ABQ8SUR7_PERAM|nr:hypothetical protein ANN_13874 [Periplaneta americana]